MFVLYISVQSDTSFAVCFLQIHVQIFHQIVHCLHKKKIEIFFSGVSKTTILINALNISLFINPIITKKQFRKSNWLGYQSSKSTNPYSKGDETVHDIL